MANVIDQQMFQYFSLLNDSEKKSVVQMLQAFLKNRISNTDRVTIEEYNTEIDEALRESDTGNFVSQDEMEKITNSWKGL
ncbi:hypothetical protein ABDK00_004005 [Niabella insulamsoli]|uniref:hypothetical protein n=1 Tax=Niabella insulamsoli TaxID=3144874 RepID=UPI0031FE0D1E